MFTWNETDGGGAAGMNECKQCGKIYVEFIKYCERCGSEIEHVDWREKSLFKNPYNIKPKTKYMKKR